jgi:uncharacterized membrane protein/protein-disulfide isomerase
VSQTLSNRVLLLLAFGGVFVSGVLSAGAYFNKLVPCGESRECAIVAAHPSSHLLGVPNAYIGLIAYLLFAMAAVYRELFGMVGKFSKMSVLLGYIAAFIGFAVSVYLTYLEFAVINAICKWCIASAVIMTLMLVFHAILFQSADEKTPAPGDKLSTFYTPIVAILSITALGLVVKDMITYHASEVNITPTTEQQLFGPSAHVLNPSGVVSVAEFGDLDCPVCHKLYKRMEDLIKSSNGRIRFAFHNFPLVHNSDHRGALAGAMISEVASDEGKFWQYIDTVYSAPIVDNAPLADNAQMAKFAQQAGVDIKEVNRRMNNYRDDPVSNRIVADINLAHAVGADRTPSYVVFTHGVPAELVSGDDVFGLLNAAPYHKLITGQ